MIEHQTRKGMPLSERFAHYVRKTDVGCWEWAGKLNSTGYASVSHGGEWLIASRVSWALHNGEISPGLHVLHRCDNPVCTNPDHLFLGTNIDNIQDKVSKNRQYRKYPPQCSVHDCAEASRKLGLCYRHYNRQYCASRRTA